MHAHSTIKYRPFPNTFQQHRTHSSCSKVSPIALQSHYDFLFHPRLVSSSLAAAATVKFISRWRTYTMIPLTAAVVGYVTNWLAVKMIFYPIKFIGTRMLGKRIGWQGIVPNKTEKMSLAMVNATLTQLIRMDEIVERLNPELVAEILLPQAPKIMAPMVEELFFQSDDNSYLHNWTMQVARSPGPLQDTISRKFLVAVTKDVQRKVNKVLNLERCVLEQTMADRSLLGKLFQIAGRKELVFLTDSGLWFGFLLGLIQVLVALICENPWTLSIGGLIVGLATNWLALKWIFEPVNPTPIIGNLVLQGLFLRRQKEVSADFSNFFASKILTSEQLWKSILTDPSTKEEFVKLWATNLQQVVYNETKGLVDLGSKNGDLTALYAVSRKATEQLYPLLDDLHPYVDAALDIEVTLRSRMMAMSSQQFERVLHPIFEEDEMTLIVAGGGLGFAAGLIQQGLATGAISFIPSWTGMGTTLAIMGIAASVYAIYSSSRIRMSTFRRRIFKRLRDPSKVAFDAIDQDKNGYLEPRELLRIATVLGITISEEELSEAFLELDKNGDGKVSLEEFEDWWNKDLGSNFHKELEKELGLYRKKTNRWSKLPQYMRP